jgi:beta-glucanase (GH16 family)
MTSAAARSIFPLVRRRRHEGSVTWRKGSSPGRNIVACLATSIAGVLLATCGGAQNGGAQHNTDAADNWTIRPSQPIDLYSFYTPDDDLNPCELAGPPSVVPGDVLVFADDFEGATVNPDAWNVANGFVGFASSLNTSSPDNAIVTNGSLLIVSDRNPADSNHPYVSSALDTRRKFARTYGKIELRARFAKASGVWYALVGRPSTSSYPIVRIEAINRSTTDYTQVYLTHEWGPATVPSADRTLSTLVDNLDFSQYHVYTIVWKPGSIEWLIDGVSKMLSTGQTVETDPTYWTMGGWVGGWPGQPPADASWPVAFEIDYFRVSRADGVIGEPRVFIGNPKDIYFGYESLEIQLANFDEACAHVDIYEGEWRMARRTKAPYRFSLQNVSHGDHTFTFVATDGVRTTHSSLALHVN